jgi:hypothetical protein
MGIGKAMKEVVVEKLTHTVLTDVLLSDWLASVGIVENAINEGVDGMEDVLDFLEEFKVESDRAIAVTAFDIEPRACGSCHMLGAWYDNDNPYSTLSGWACVYENGPVFKYDYKRFNDTARANEAMKDKWFKVCEHYIRRVD